MIKMQAVRKENFDLSTRVEDLEREKEHYVFLNYEIITNHYLEPFLRAVEALTR